MKKGVLRHDVVSCFEATTQGLLRFLALDGVDGPLVGFKENSDPKAKALLPMQVPVWRYDPSAKIRWPVDAKGFPTALVHRDLQVIFFLHRSAIF